ncbi:MAG: hypothetical protein WC505_04770 [Patescibacteria group bacterium]
MKFAIVKRDLIRIFTKYFVLISVITTLLIIGAGYQLFIKGTVADIRSIGVIDLKEREQQKLNLIDTLERLKRLETRYNELTYEEIKQLEYLLPDEREIPYIVIELKDFIAANGLVLKSIDVGVFKAAVGEEEEETKAVSLKSLNVTVTIEGLDTYAQIKDFLDKLGTLMPPFELNSFSYAPDRTSYSLNLTTYYK